MHSPCAGDALLNWRLLVVGVLGSALAVFGVIANSLLALLFLTCSNYRHSAYFFLGCVALWDTLLDFTYLILLPVPIVAEYFDDLDLYLYWLSYFHPVLYFGQVFKVASAFSLVVASFERFFITRHWTFSGFQYRTRLFIFVVIVLLATLSKMPTYTDIKVVTMKNCTGFQRFRAGHASDSPWLSGFVNTITIGIPFFALVSLNGGIVMMLRHQNVQQLRSLITELTIGHDAMKARRRNLRLATHTLLVIITAYLISNLLNMALTLTEFLDPDLLARNRRFYRIAVDTASVLTVLGNAIRCPVHLMSNREIRSRFVRMYSLSSQLQQISHNITRAKELSRVGSLRSSMSSLRSLRSESKGTTRMNIPWITLLLPPVVSAREKQPMLDNLV